MQTTLQALRGRSKRIPDLSLLFWRHTHPGILDLDNGDLLALVDPRPRCHLSAGRRELDGVVQQVPDCIRDPFAIPRRVNQAQRRLHLKFEVAPPRFKLHHFNSIRKQGRKIDRFQREPALFFQQGCISDQIFDHLPRAVYVLR